MKFYLIGMPGCGKTTTGKLIASQANLKFLDLDDQIIARAGKSINEIFIQDGEDHFRSLEQNQLQEISKEYHNILLATGGGAPCFFDNMEFMNLTGHTIYLSVDPGNLVDRLLIYGTAERPLLKDRSKEDLLGEINLKLKTRESFYSRAHVIIDYNKIDPVKVLNAIRDLKEKPG